MTESTTVRELRTALPAVTTGYDERTGDIAVFIEPEPGTATTLEESLTWFRENREHLDELVTQAGAIVLRGFPFETSEDFSALAEEYPEPGEHGYVGGATAREGISGRAYEATSLPAAYHLDLHQEMSYLPHYPTKLAFFCKQPSETGGATVIGDMRRFTQIIDPEFLDRIRTKGVRYIRHFRAPGVSTGDATLDAFHKTWTTTFETEDRAVAEKAITDMGMEFQWRGDELFVLYTSPGMIKHPQTGEELWFNQIAGMADTVEAMGEDRVALYRKFYDDEHPKPYVTQYGDGSPIDVEDIRGLYPKLAEVEVGFPWQHGDVMIIDNFNTAHGRDSYTGKRDIQVALLG